MGVVWKEEDECHIRVAFGLIMLDEMHQLLERGDFEQASALGEALLHVCGWDTDEYERAARDGARLGAWAMARASELTKDGRRAEEIRREHGREAVREAERILYGDKPRE